MGGRLSHGCAVGGWDTQVNPIAVSRRELIFVVYIHVEPVLCSKQISVYCYGIAGYVKLPCDVSLKIWYEIMWINIFFVVFVGTYHLNRNIVFDKAKTFHWKTTERTAKSGTAARIGVCLKNRGHVSKLAWRDMFNISVTIPAALGKYIKVHAPNDLFSLAYDHMGVNLQMTPLKVQTRFTPQNSYINPYAMIENKKLFKSGSICFIIS